MARQRGHGASADATIEDVASAAGVSMATVSRALRGLPNVAPETRARVAEAASRLRYQPDPHASRLAAGRTSAIGMAVPLLDRWYFGKIVAGVESALRHRNYDLIVYEVDGEAALRRFLSEAAPYRKRTDGLIIADLVVPADLPPRGPVEPIVYGPLLSDDGALLLGAAVLLEAPDAGAARDVLPADRYSGVEVHRWAFGGRQ